MYRYIKTIYLLSAAVFLSAGYFIPEARAVAIAIVNDQNLKKADVCIEGFKETLAESGYSDGANVSYLNYDIASPETTNILAAEKYDIVCAVGLSAQKIKSIVKNKPIVFMAVLNPVSTGVVSSMLASGSNITGVSLDTPADVQLRLLKKILPGSTKVGIVYGPRFASLVSDASKLETELNLQIVPISVASYTEVPNALQNVAGKLDALWLTPDGSIFTKDSLSWVLNYTYQKKIPVMGFASNLVKAGALFSGNYDFKDIGKQTGELMVRIIKGEKPGDIPIAVPRKSGYVLNVNTAKYLGLNLSPSIMGGADESY